MSSHAFRLASVLSLRDSQLTEAGSAVAQIESEIQLLESASYQVDASRRAVQQGFVQERSVSSAELRQAAEYLEVLEHEYTRLREQVELARRRVLDARSMLVERHQAVSVLKKLRDRLDEAATLDDQHSEQRALDEVAGAQSYRSRRQ
jgi:flagellar export protein FliJ